MLILVLFLITLCLGLITMYKCLQLQSVKQENALMDSYIESMREFYMVLANRAETIQKYRHDLANHIHTLQTLSARQEGFPAITKYMEGLTEQYDQLQAERYCSNDIINSVLTLKKQQCDHKRIPLKLQISNFDDVGISDFDFVSFLHNILDNAIEANERIPQSAPRGISFYMGVDRQSLWIILENHVTPNSEISFQTQKKNKEKHGFGIKIINSIVTRYHGQQKTSLDEKRYILTQKFIFPINAGHKEN